MVAGIFEKTKRLRQVLFFIVQKLPISRAARAAANLRNVWRLSRRCSYPFVELVNAELKKTTGRLRGQVFPQTPSKAFRPSWFEFFRASFFSACFRPACLRDSAQNFASKLALACQFGMQDRARIVQPATLYRC